MRYLILLAAAAITAAPVAAQTAASPSPAPDYQQETAWLCRPGRHDACTVDQDVTVIQANGTRRIERFEAAAHPTFDCFYVYPTVSLDPSPNSDMTAGAEEDDVVQAQAARFRSQCRLFAPLYRQVTLTALRQTMMGGHPALDRAMAYRDVKAAWEDYLARDNKGRGVVLIGHSQGSGLLKQLIADDIEGKPAQQLLVGAYLAGTNLAVPAGEAVGGDLKQVPICTRDGQYGCVVAWVTFRAGTTPPDNTRFAIVPTAGQEAACVNAAALGGGKAVTDAIFTTAGPGNASLPMTSWTTDGKPVTTPFVRVPGLISAECVHDGRFHYLAMTVNADPADPRTDTITGDVVANGVTLKDWGLHLIDLPVEMGDLVALSGRQAKAWAAARH